MEEKTEIRYHYDDDLEIKYSDGYTSAFNSNGFAIINFFYEYPRLLDKTYFKKTDHGEITEQAEDNDFIINRKVHTAIRCDVEVLRNLYEDIGNFLEEFDLSGDD